MLRALHLGHVRISARVATVPALPAFGRRGGDTGARFLVASFPFLHAAVQTGEEGEDDEGADGAADADHDRLVVVDPRLDFTSGRGAFTLALVRFC